MKKSATLSPGPAGVFKTPIHLPLLTFASLFQVTKIVLTSKLLFPMSFCKGSAPSDSNLIMNTSRTSKRSNSPAFPFQRPSHNFPLYLSLLWLLRLRVNTPNTSSPPCNAGPGPGGPPWRFYLPHPVMSWVQEWQGWVTSWLHRSRLRGAIFLEMGWVGELMLQNQMGSL